MTTLSLYCPSKQIHGKIALQGSKSISNRVLVIRALCDNPFIIENLSPSDDTVTLERLLSSADEMLDAHHAGTTFRFMTAFLALKGRECVLTGSPRMKQRPVKALVEALNQLGANIKYLEQEGYPPLKIGQGKEKWLSHISLPADISSQYITALMLIGPVLPSGLTIELEGDIVSRPYLEMTTEIMQYFGAAVEWQDNSIKVQNGSYRGRDFYVEADWSAASYYYEIAGLSDNAEITLTGLGKNSLQGDSMIAEMGEKFGIETIFGDQQITIRKKAGSVVPPFFEYDFIRVPDIAQSLAVLCAGLGTQGLFSGLQTLKIKETDRISAIKNELAKVGVTLIMAPARFSRKTGTEYYILEGRASGEGTVPQFETYNDHRMAMSFAPLGILFPIIISDAEVVSKSYPGFWKDLASIGFEIQSR